MAKSDELVTYITQRIVRYMETPRDVRRSQKQAREPGEQMVWHVASGSENVDEIHTQRTKRATLNSPKRPQEA